VHSVNHNITAEIHPAADSSTTI